MRQFSRAWVVALLVLGAFAAPVAASDGPDRLEIGESGTINPSDRTTVVVPVEVHCTSNTESPTGTATVTLTQDYRGSTTTGTGTADVICDGVARTYLVTVTATEGIFRKGPATAKATVGFPYRLCASNGAGDVQCTTFTMTMIPDPEPIALRVGR